MPGVLNLAVTALNIGNGLLYSAGTLSAAAGVTVKAERSASASTVITSADYYIGYTGTGGHTFTMPSASENAGTEILVKNKGTGNVVVDASDPLGRIYTSSLVSTVTLTPGEEAYLLSDGINWVMSDFPDSIAGTAGQVLTNGGVGPITGGTVTLSLASSLTSINSITSTAGTALTLGTGTSGTALVFASATNIATFSAGIVGDSLTASAVTNLTLSGGSSGASLVLGQGTNGAVTLTATGSGNVVLASTTGIVTTANRLTVTNTTASTSSSTGAVVISGGAGFAGDVWVGAAVAMSTVDARLRLQRTSGPNYVDFNSGQIFNLRSIDTDDLNAVNRVSIAPTTGVVTIASTIASTSTTTGSLINSGGFGNAGASYFGGQMTITGTNTLRFGATAAATIGVSADTTSGTLTINPPSAAGIRINGPSAQTIPGIDLWDGGIALNIGADNLEKARTNITNKVGRIMMPHYTNAEEPVTLISAGSQASLNGISIGGGTILGNAATEINFYTAANTTTTTGTARLTIDSAGVTTVTATTASSSATTGALVVSGGVGVAGDVYVGGQIVASASVGTGGVVFSGDTNTGLMWEGTDSFTAYLGGARRVHFTTDLLASYTTGAIALGSSSQRWNGIYTSGTIRLTPSLTQSAEAWGTAGVLSAWASATATDSSTLASGTATSAVFHSFAAPTLAATNLTVTTTDAATVYIAGAPAAGTNQTITNLWALWVDSGNVRFDDSLLIGGTTLTQNPGSQKLWVEGSVSDHFVTLKNTNATGASSIAFNSDGGGGVLAYTGFAHASHTITNIRSKAFWASAGNVDLAILSGTTRHVLINGVTGQVSIEAAIASTSKSTGALVLSGANAGLGVAGNIYGGGVVDVRSNSGAGTSRIATFVDNIGTGGIITNVLGVFGGAGADDSGSRIVFGSSAVSKRGAIAAVRRTGVWGMELYTSDGTDSITLAATLAHNVGLTLTGTLKTAAGVAYNFGAASAGAPTADSKIRVTVGGATYDIAAALVP